MLRNLVIETAGFSKLGTMANQYYVLVNSKWKGPDKN